MRGSRVGGRPGPAASTTTAEPVAAASTPASGPSENAGHEVAASTFDTSPIVGIDEALRLDAAEHESGGSRGHQARAHEAAAEVLADRGEWRRAYQHLRAAMTLVHLGESPPVHVPEQLRREVDRLRRERAEAREQSRRDSLTATWNRRYLDERLSTLRDESAASVCVALVDVDHFKLVNDTYGHAVGDSVLRTLVTLMREGIAGTAPDGFCARYGGEEFALVLAGTGADEAVATCERIRARVEEHDWTTIAPDLRVTVSAGVGCLEIGAPDDDEDPTPTALDRVDELLYVAKRTGRNAVAFRDVTGRVRLAGPAAGRRGVEAVVRSVCEAPRPGHVAR